MRRHRGAGRIGESVRHLRDRRDRDRARATRDRSRDTVQRSRRGGKSQGKASKVGSILFLTILFKFKTLTIDFLFPLITLVFLIEDQL